MDARLQRLARETLLAFVLLLMKSRLPGLTELGRLGKQLVNGVSALLPRGTDPSVAHTVGGPTHRPSVGATNACET